MCLALFFSGCNHYKSIHFAGAKIQLFLHSARKCTLSQKKVVSLQIEREHTYNTIVMETTARGQHHTDNTLLYLRKQASELALQTDSEELLTEVIAMLRKGYYMQQHREELTIPDGYMSLEQFEDELVKAVTKRL